MAADAPTGNPLFEELLWVHSMIRRDLAAVSELAERVAGGLEPDEVRAELDDLAANGPLFQLKLGCLHYCRFVHHHHRLEDAAVFPTLRRMDSELAPVIDRLESEHREVATRLDAVERAATALETADDAVTRDHVVEALSALGDALLAHLEFEERSLQAPLRELRSWSG